MDSYTLFLLHMALTVLYFLISLRGRPRLHVVTESIIVLAIPFFGLLLLVFYHICCYVFSLHAGRQPDPAAEGKAFFRGTQLDEDIIPLNNAMSVDDVQKKGVDRGEGVPPYDLVEYHATEVTRKIVSYGSMDLRNPEAGYDPATAVKRADPIEADTWYDYTIWLQPNFYTVQPGHRLEVYILPFCGFSSTDFALELSTPEQLVEYGVDPASIVPFHHDYSFTVNGGSVDIPVVSSGK